MESGMIPHGHEGEISCGPSTTTVTGMSGQSDDTLAKVSLPFGVGEGVTASYTADLIGGAGSTFPALLPNPSLWQMRSIVLTQWYDDNGDGVMVCCTSGHRPDHPDAVFVVMKPLFGREWTLHSSSQQRGPEDDRPGDERGVEDLEETLPSDNT